MLVTKEVITTESVEIKLPYYAKNGNTFFRINEDESILEIYSNNGFNSIRTLDKNSNYLLKRDIIAAAPCTAEEVEQAARLTLIQMEEVLNINQHA